MADFLHNRNDFESLVRTLATEMGILETLVEKDYWIMHVLHSLKAEGFVFELKGGTSLSKGFKIIDRFSEDIDLHISPPDRFTKETGIKVNENPKATKKNQNENRKDFFDWLAANIKIEGIIEITRDTDFDDKNYRSGGIRLKYKTFFDPIEGIKEGVLLEAGFAKVTPNSSIDISSWMYDRAIQANLKITDNRALEIACYHPGYTFVEKLQTIVTKYRLEQAKGEDQLKVNFMRQYYDVFQLLKEKQIQEFITTQEYVDHKDYWFPEEDKKLALKDNPALLLTDEKIRKEFRERFKQTKDLYFKGQPDFDKMISFIHRFLDML